MDERLARAFDVVLRDVPTAVALGDSFVSSLATLADQVQTIVKEAQWDARMPVGWPRCERHPGTHPLEAAVVSEQAVWRRPRDGTVVARVGHLNAHGS